MSYIGKLTPLPQTLIENLVSDLSGTTATANTIHVSFIGSDTTGNGSQSKPFRTILKGVQTANPLASPTNPFIVYVDTGVYDESPITLNPYVSITSIEQDRVIIRPNDVNNPLITMGDFSSLGFLTLSGVTSSDAVLIDNAATIAVLHKVYFKDNYVSARVRSTTSASYAYFEYVSSDNSSYAGVIAESTVYSYVSLENTYFYNITTLPAISDIVSDGNNTNVVFHSGAANNQFSPLSNTSVLSTNGGNLTTRNVEYNGYQYAILCNAGGTPNIVINSCSFINNVYNFYINNTASTGYFDGYTEYTKYFINSNNFFITNDDQNVITVASKGGNFTSIKSAIDSITDNSSTKIYTIRVGSGVFIEDTITLKPFVFIRGESFTSTIIEIDDVNKTIINASPNSGLFSIQLRGATGTTGRAINFTGGSGVFRCVEVRFGANRNFYFQTSSSGVATSIFQNCSAEATSNFTTAFEITDNGTNLSTFAFNSFTYTGNGVDFIKAYGTNTQISSANYTVSKTNNLGFGVHLYNGAICSINSVTLIGFNKAIYNENTGAGSTIFTNAVSIRNCTTDIEINNPNTNGSVNAFATRTKIIINQNASVSLLMTDVTGDGTVSLGKIWLGEKYSEVFDAKDLITSGAMGVHEGGILSAGTGFTVNISEGHGYLEDDTVTPEIYKRIEWASTAITLSSHQDRFIFINNNGVLNSSPSRPNNQENIILGRVVTNALAVRYIEQAKSDGDHTVNKLSTALRDVFGAVFSSGGIVTTNTSRQIQVSSGKYYLAEIPVTMTGKTFTTNFTIVYRDGSGGWTYSGTTTNAVDNTVYDNNTGTPVTIGSNSYVKHLLYVTNNGTVDSYYLILGQSLHNNQLEAEQSPLPNSPAEFREHTILLASIITKSNDNNFTAVVDLRPRPSFAAQAATTVTDHASLSGLQTDSHLIYLLLDGSLPMTGNINMGGNNITNVNLVDGIDVTTHASRHLPNGSDPLETSTAVTISRLTENTVGIANSFARADHTHKVIEEIFTATTVSTILTDTIPSNIVVSSGATIALGTGYTQTGKTFRIYNNSIVPSTIQRTSTIFNATDFIVRLDPYTLGTFVLYEIAGSNQYWTYTLNDFSTHINAPQALKKFFFEDDFIGVGVGGQTNWTSTVNGAGAANGLLAGTYGLGELVQSAGTTAAGRASAVKTLDILRLDIVAPSTSILINEWIVVLPLLSTATERYIYRVGLGDNTGAGDFVDGVYFEYDEGVSGDVWRLKTSTNNVRTTAVTTTPVVAATRFRLRIEVSGTVANYFINNTPVGTINTNVPVGVGRGTSLITKIEKTVGTTNRQSVVDYISLKTYRVV